MTTICIRRRLQCELIITLTLLLDCSLTTSAFCTSTLGRSKLARLKCSAPATGTSSSRDFRNRREQKPEPLVAHVDCTTAQDGQQGVVITSPYYLVSDVLSDDEVNQWSGMHHHDPSSHLLHKIHVQPCLSLTEAHTCLNLAEEYAAATGCWNQSTGRHTSYNTVDFEVEECEGLSQYLDDIEFHTRITQKLSNAYGIDPSHVSYLDLFCSHYEAKKSTDNTNDEEQEEPERQTMDRLILHRDGSLLSFTVLLSDPSVDFEGGGTIFECLKDVAMHYTSESATSAEHVRVCSNGTVRPQKLGYCTLHSGKMLHGADVITSGSRCVFVGFMDVAPFVQTPGRLAEACKQWGRMDVMIERYQWQEKQMSLEENRSRGGWMLRNKKYLPKKSVDGVGISHLRNFVTPFPSVEKRAQPKFQRLERLKVEDWFLRGAMLAPEQRDPNELFGGDITLQ